jgi:hypothetical protein
MINGSQIYNKKTNRTIEIEVKDQEGETVDLTKEIKSIAKDVHEAIKKFTPGTLTRKLYPLAAITLKRSINSLTTGNELSVLSTYPDMMYLLLEFGLTFVCLYQLISKKNLLIETIETEREADYNDKLGTLTAMTEVYLMCDANLEMFKKVIKKVVEQGNVKQEWIDEFLEHINETKSKDTEDTE